MRDKSGGSRIYIRMVGVTRRKITVCQDIRGTINRSHLPFKIEIELKRTSFTHFGISRAINRRHSHSRRPPKDAQHIHVPEQKAEY